MWTSPPTRCARAHVLQSAAFDHADEFPSVEPGILGAQGRRGVTGFAIVSDYAEFVEDLSSGEAYGGPKALTGAMLFRHRRAGNRNHLCVPQMTPPVPSLSSYWQEFAPPARADPQQIGNQARQLDVGLFQQSFQTVLQLHPVARQLVLGACHSPPQALFGIRHKAQNELTRHQPLHQSFG